MAVRVRFLPGLVIVTAVAATIAWAGASVPRHNDRDIADVSRPAAVQTTLISGSGHPTSVHSMTGSPSPTQASETPAAPTPSPSAPLSPASEEPTASADTASPTSRSWSSLPATTKLFPEPDNCPQGDWSGSFFDGRCAPGPVPTATASQSVPNLQNQPNNNPTSYNARCAWSKASGRDYEVLCTIAVPEGKMVVGTGCQHNGICGQQVQYGGDTENRFRFLTPEVQGYIVTFTIDAERVVLRF